MQTTEVFVSVLTLDCGCKIDSQLRPYTYCPDHKPESKPWR